MHRFSITVDPSPAQLARYAGAVGTPLSDWRPVFVRLVPIFQGEFRANFASKGARLEKPWDPLKKTYARRKAKSGRGSSIAVLTGETRDQLTGPPMKMTKTTLIMGVDTPQGRVLQYGSRKQNTGARTIIGWTQRMKDAALEAIQRESQIRYAKAARLLERNAAGG